ncbi:hypothetical protein CTAYLR_008168 [Chrysophaeum taylorii]|uniref:Uncharacterized protein n=1 Tax=Chrysophaeum taylorii TaxID=2483200 RepID=A0AAD7U936_9STRA|nr:hypothetical protein CTAYLR_008168 [Chrysophaeum taylorii]
MLVAVGEALATMRVVVTGANKGIGRAIVERLLRDYSDVHVYLAARSAERGVAACDEIAAKMPEAASRLEFLEMDVSDDVSVRRAADSLGPGPLYGLVNNAGIGFGRGFRDALQTNFYGPMRVCEALLPLLKQSDPAGRIVNIASASAPNFVNRCGVREHRDVLARPAASTLDAVLDIAKSYETMTDYEDAAYGLSKACLNALTVFLARDNPDLVVNSCTPGYILTDLTRGMGASKKPEEGTKAPVYLLMDPEPASLPTGRFYGSDAKRSPLDRYREPGTPPYDGP